MAAAPPQSNELPGEAPTYPPQAQPAPVETYAAEPKTEAHYAAPAVQSTQPRRGFMSSLDLIIVGAAGVLFVFNFIVLVLTAIRVAAANESYDYLYLTLNETKYLLAMSVIDIPAIVYLALYGSGITSITNVIVDKQSIAPTVLASVLALLFLIAGALEARLASYSYFCNYYYDVCTKWNESSHGQVAAASAFAFFIFIIWTFVAVWCGLRTRKTTAAGVSTV